jgi:conjugal transfer ATP-binding protein TraC
MIPKLNIRLPFTKKKKGKKALYEEYKNNLLKYLTSPSTVKRHSDYIEMDKCHRVIAAINYPRVVDAGWLTRLVEMNLDFDLSMHIRPYPLESSISMLESEIKKQKTDIYAFEAEGKIIPQSLVQKHQDTKALLDQIQQGREKMFDMSLYIDAKSYDGKELDTITSKIKTSMASIMITPKVPSYQMYAALKSVLPIADDELHITRNITSSATAACFPFAITSLEHHASGILIGFNQLNNIPIVMDPFKLSNPNVLVLGTSGGGKSFCIKLMLMREFMEGVDINVIDPQAEYADLVERFEGKVIRIAPNSDTVINPMDLMGQNYDEKKLSLLSFFRVLMGELTETQRAILDDSIDSTYEDAGITKDPRTWSKKPPVLGDLYDHVLPLTRSDKEIIYKPATAIVTRLKPFVSGGLSFMNQHTKIDLDNRFISFDIKDMPDVGKGAVMYLLLEYIYNKMKKSRKRRICVVDEAWTVLSAGEEGEYIFRLIKTSRKFNLSLILLTQDVEDVMTSRAGRAVMANTATKLLMKQDTTVVSNIVDKFHLNEAEAEFVRRAKIGSALLIAENSRIPIYIKASPEEHRIITTKPDELTEFIREPTGPEIEREVKLEFDITKPVHRESQLSYEEIQTLTRAGFHEFKADTLEGIREVFMIKNETDESDNHFVLQQLVNDEVEKYTDRIKVHYATLPDIIFETPKGDIVAIEIIDDPDIGTSLEKMGKKLKMLKRYNSYFFVVSNPELKKHDEFGEVVLRINFTTKIRNFFE